MLSLLCDMLTMLQGHWGRNLLHIWHMDC
jgi:hypothetical protein